MVSKKHTFKLDEGVRGEMILTPKLAELHGVHIYQIEDLVKDRSRETNQDLYFELNLNPQGIKIVWGPSSDLDLNELEEIKD